MLFHRLIAVPAVASGLAIALTDLGPVKGLNRRQAKSTQCVVPANGDGSDDTPAILAVFDKCKTDGHIVFENVTYHIGQIMNTTDLNNVKIDIKGTLLVSDVQSASCSITCAAYVIDSGFSGARTRLTGWRILSPLATKTRRPPGFWVESISTSKALAMAHSMVTARLGMTWSRENRTILVSDPR